jgi:AcrR family transcriptional regulator
MSTTPGLRERKKAKTRAAIQTHALRLIAEQGYEATTVEQIAEAAEISPSTFFRYFPTKEDVVVEDGYDPMILAAFEAAGTAERPLTRLRAAVREVLSMIGDEEAQILERTQLIFAVPALRARTLQNMLSTMDLLAGTLARASGLPADDRRVRIFTGAIVGAWMVVLVRWAEGNGEERLAEILDEALATLEDGLDRPLAG